MGMVKTRKFKGRNRISQIAVQNNAIRTNHIKVRIDRTLQNSKCRLCGDRDETINHIITECSKFVQKGASVLENDTDKLQWDFNIQTYLLISARRPDFIIINKK